MQTISPTSIRRKAFTLIELLTVIAIIGILAAILIPVVGSVRQSARNTQCITNLREIHLAVTMFVEDRGGYPRARLTDLPGHDPAFWFGALSSYLDEGRRFVQQDWETRKPFTVFACPEGDPTVWASDYGLNGFLLNPGVSTSVGQTVPETAIEDHTGAVLVADTATWQLGNQWSGFTTSQLRFRHRDQANLLHFAGNVSQVREADLNDADFLRRLAGRD